MNTLQTNAADTLSRLTHNPLTLEQLGYIMHNLMYLGVVIIVLALGTAWVTGRVQAAKSSRKWDTRMDAEDKGWSKDVDWR